MEESQGAETQLIHILWHFLPVSSCIFYLYHTNLTRRKQHCTVKKEPNGKSNTKSYVSLLHQSKHCTSINITTSTMSWSIFQILAVIFAAIGVGMFVVMAWRLQTAWLEFRLDVSSLYHLSTQADL
jgi:hypothetical protein